MYIISAMTVKEPITLEFLGLDAKEAVSEVGYYKENEMHPGDNPPVGILLCTRKGKKMVEYALSGMDNMRLKEFKKCKSACTFIRKRFVR